MRQTRNLLKGQTFRGFESPPLRLKPKIYKPLRLPPQKRLFGRNLSFCSSGGTTFIAEGQGINSEAAPLALCSVLH